MGGTSTGGSDSPSRDFDWLGCDCVVVFAAPGWKQELRSNRYHWTRRWARHLPVVMVQPDTAPRKRAWSEAAPGIDGCELLHVQRIGNVPSTPVAVAQARAIGQRLRERGLDRPLVWTYAPMLGLAAVLTPAVVRVHHATENYYAYAGLSEGFFWSLSLCVRSADLVVAVSSGVASGLRKHEPDIGGALVEVTNGCDFAQAAATPYPDPVVAGIAGGRRVAVFAGNLNGRVDVELVAQIARANADSLVLLVGPISGLDPPERARLQQVLAKPNVHHEEAMDPGRLPAVYRAADVGMIPYLPLPNIVDDGFPLKVLEMAATGLPVVSSMMRPIVDLHPAIRVVSDRDGFVDALRETGRRALGPETGESLVALARASDYDLKFAEVAAHLRGRQLPRVPRTRYDIASGIETGSAGSPLLAPADFDSYLPTRLAHHAVARAHDALVPRIPPAARKRIKSLAKRTRRS